MSYGKTYFETINMTRTMNGLGALGAGSANGLDADLGTTVIGGTTLCVGLPLAFKGAKKIVWDAPKWAYQNYGNYREGFGTLLTNYKQNYANARDLSRTLKGDNLFQTVGNRVRYDKLISLEGSIPSNLSTGFDKAEFLKLKAENPAKAKEYLEKFKQNRTEAKKCYEAAKNKIKSIKDRVKSGSLKGSALKKEIGELEGLIEKGNKNLETLVKSGKIKAGSKLAQMWSKTKAGLSKVTGMDAAGKALAKGAKSSSRAVSSTCKGLSKGAKAFVKSGGAATAAIEFAFEVPEIVQTFRECGSGAGWKQVGKSAFVATASGVGFWVGSTVGASAGAWAGAATGAALGSVVPGIGNVVGAIVGLGCGLLGSWLFGKGAKALVGKSELEKKKEQEAQQAAVEAYNDPKKMEELVNAYEQMINERDQMVQEGIEDEQISCPQDNTYVAQPELDTQLSGLHLDTKY